MVGSCGTGRWNFGGEPDENECAHGQLRTIRMKHGLFLSVYCGEHSGTVL